MLVAKGRFFALSKAAFLYISIAFGRVNHKILIGKLKSIGVIGPSLRWLSSYLNSRLITTSVNHVDSPTKPISSGVPQGSVLGPLLFLIYMSELPLSVKKSTCALFVDDTLLHSSGCKPWHVPLPCCDLQQDVNAVHLWSTKLNTLFNATKSHQIIISSKKIHHQAIVPRSH